MTDLFAHFEVNRDPRGQMLLKLLGGSIVAHLLFVLFVMYVPAVRSAFNIAALIGDTTFVDRDYTATQIGDEVQLVELTSEKFRYPDGYWAPEGQLPEAPPVPQLISAAPVTQSFPPLATPSPSVLAEASPSPGAVAGNSTSTTAQASPTPTGPYEG